MAPRRPEESSAGLMWAMQAMAAKPGTEIGLVKCPDAPTHSEHVKHVVLPSHDGPASNLQSQSGFCRLPGELRNRIYDDVLPRDALIKVSIRSSTSAQPAITRVCKLLRFETLPPTIVTTTSRWQFRMGP